MIRLYKSQALGDFEQFNKQAVAKHTGFTVHDTELEKERDGRLVYKIELKDAKGVEWNYDVDAKTGEVVRDAKDN
ncbi:Peptidase propeptide/YPEB domain-containing protein [Pseudomonas amygdali pv. photiniae]|uniref:Peptidase propeptide/YPEB domain-containing protein n=3 Tax=Pseudomonas syringae group TaxID=136849 RepID=A0A0P9U802_PSEA0|nr:Peptidase propeptide/YPEB domain-containing protein [Pseudomonas amygdali pv. photiniae]RMP07541.1 Peptidase propeptide/YPEB domain-containing protein [Pseudomonas syringae pv. persicae]RMR11927.1 Peptidase propeptide/YPEB domain-containing protein [Pseudomonas savastanoi pv. glycinea]RMS54614.1 Peptidase propeptide/YPEB domain-containing protein [Pseudomonas amygdali pv. photiniae]RMT72387.1 Peptidase propeptide/YPEB domain-containing protein [Pseudomonas savastanoi pv. nerii]